MAEQIYTVRRDNVRISPRKMRLAADLIRGKTVQQATDALEFSLTKSSRLMGKVLANAIANAEQSSADIDELVIDRVVVNKAMKLRRFKPSARGRIRANCHRYSKVDLQLVERAARRKAAAAPAAPADQPAEQTAPAAPDGDK